MILIKYNSHLIPLSHFHFQWNVSYFPDLLILLPQSRNLFPQSHELFSGEVGGHGWLLGVCVCVCVCARVCVYYFSQTSIFVRNGCFLPKYLKLRLYIRKMGDLVQLYHAVTMIPFIYFSLYGFYGILQGAVTLTWATSFIYHMLLLYEKQQARIMFKADCLCQIATLVCLALATPCYTYQIKILGSVFGSGAIICLTQTNKYHAVVICSHVSQTLCALYHACDYSHMLKSFWAALISMVLYFVCDYGKIEFAWSIAHITLFWYTYYMWKALGVL